MRHITWAGWLPRRAGRAGAHAGLLVAGLALAAQLVALLAGTPPVTVDAPRIAAGGAAAALCLLRAALVRADRAAWTLLGAGVLAWIGAELAWLAAPRRAELPLPPGADAGYLLFGLLVTVGLVLLLRGRSVVAAPRGLAADAVAVVLAAGAVAATLVGPRLASITAHASGGAAVAVAFPVLDVALVVVLLIALTASGFHEPSWWPLAAGMVLYVAADVAYLFAAAPDSPVSGWWGLVAVTGVVLLGVAAWTRPVAVRQLRLRAWPQLALPGVAVTVALVVLAATSADRPQPGAVPLAVAAIAVVAVRAVSRTAGVTESARAAVTDELTGLANRRLLLARLDAALAGPAPEPHALVLLDLNSFKEINDTLGHPVGDELLRRLGPRLAGTVRQGETVARLGGDEFAVLLPGIDTERAGLKAAERVLAGLLGAFVIDGLTLLVTASAGVALAPRHGTEGSTLLRCADVAMYQAKRGGGGAAVYRPRTDPHSRSRLGAATDLKGAIAAGDIVCVYQPQVDLATGLPVGAEALVRWSDPRRGLVPPQEFLPLAQQAGLMPALSDAVVRSALADARGWRTALPTLRVAVNVAAGSLLDFRLPERVAAALSAAGLPAGTLILEVADGALTDAGRARTVVRRLHEMGVCVSLDDYGTARSAVVLLRELPVDQLKLDAALVGAVLEDPRARAIVEHTVRMAHALDIEVVAKGVEDAATLALVGRLGCDSAQGFLLAGPMTAAELTGWLLDRRAAAAHG